MDEYAATVKCMFKMTGHPGKVKQRALKRKVSSYKTINECSRLPWPTEKSDNAKEAYKAKMQKLKDRRTR